MWCCLIKLMFTNEKFVFRNASFSVTASLTYTIYTHTLFFSRWHIYLRLRRKSNKRFSHICFLFSVIFLSVSKHSFDYNCFGFIVGRYSFNAEIFSFIFAVYLNYIFLCCLRCSCSRFPLLHTDLAACTWWRMANIQIGNVIRILVSNFCIYFPVFHHCVKCLLLRIRNFASLLTPFWFILVHECLSQPYTFLYLSFPFDVHSTFCILLYSKQRQPHPNTIQCWKLRHKIDLILFMWTYVTEK